MLKKIAEVEFLKYEEPKFPELQSSETTRRIDERLSYARNVLNAP